MTSRFLIGATMRAVITGTAAAQRPGERAGMIQKLRERTAERQSKAADPNPTRIAAAGDYRFSFVHGGLRREYLVHVPRSYRPDRPTPMLLALHGGGGDADFQSSDAKYGLVSKSDEAGFIAVFPNGYSRFPSGILATWNAGTCCGRAVQNGVDDVGFLKEVIQRVSRQVNVDRNRIFSTGMSNGGLMSYRLACELPGMIRGIAPVAGTDNTTACTPSRPVPVIHFHAKDDSHILFTGGHGPDSLVKTDFTSVPATIDKWVTLNRAQPASRRVLAVPGAHCDLYAAKAGGAPVELCVTETGGHSWPGGGTQQGRKQPSMAISANDLMWEFFSSYDEHMTDSKSLLPIMAALPLLLSGCVVGTVAETAVDIVTLPVKVASAGVDAATTSQSEIDEKRGRELRKQDEERGRQARAMAERCRKGRPQPTDVCSPNPN